MTPTRSLRSPSLLLLTTVTCGIVSAGCARLPEPPPFRALHQPPKAENLKAAKVPEAGRFDTRVRDDFFYGIDGHPEALDRAMAICEQTLAAQPNHAEAMAWYGSGLLFRAGQAFVQKDFRKGNELWKRALRTLEEALPAIAVPAVAG